MQPLTLVHLAEEKQLQPLPAAPFEVVTWHQSKVAHDCHIQVGGTLYFVPYRYLGKTVAVKLGSTVVEVYLDFELIKTHLRGAKGQRVTDWNDYPPEKAAFFQRTPDWYRQRASLIGSEGESRGFIQFLEILLEDEVQRRADKRLARRITQAHFEEEKSLEGFDFNFNPKIPAQHINDLAALPVYRAERVDNLLWPRWGG